MLRGSTGWSERVERCGVLHRATDAVEGPGHQSVHHPGLGSHREGGFNAAWMRRLEAEAWIVRGMPEHDDQAMAKAARLGERTADQCRADSRTL